jgi:hypothetical protein
MHNLTVMADQIIMKELPVKLAHLHVYLYCSRTGASQLQQEQLGRNNCCLSTETHKAGHPCSSYLSGPIISYLLLITRFKPSLQWPWVEARDHQTIKHQTGGKVTINFFFTSLLLAHLSYLGFMTSLLDLRRPHRTTETITYLQETSTESRWMMMSRGTKDLLPGHQRQTRQDIRSSPPARRFGRKGCRTPGTSGGVAQGSFGYMSSRIGGSIWWSQPDNNQTRNRRLISTQL